jgi:hypothetical protein
LRRFQAKSRALYQDRLGPRSKEKKRKEKKRKEKKRGAMPRHAHLHLDLRVLDRETLLTLRA